MGGESICPRCGALTPSGSTTCPACGAALGVRPAGQVSPDDEEAQLAPPLRPSSIFLHGGGEGPTPVYAPPPKRPIPPPPPADAWYSTRGVAGASPASPEAPTPTPAPGRAGLFSDIPLAAPEGLSGWLTVAGAAVATFSLLLPWASRDGFVIGHGLGEGLLGTWGLAAPANWVILILLAVTLAVALRTPPYPGRLRYGYLPLVVGMLALGNVWPYVSYLFTVGFGPGVWLMFGGAAVMAIGGALELRGSEPEPSD